MDDVASGAVRYLAQSSAIRSLLGFIPASDPNQANVGQPFIFRANLLATLEGTSQAAIVCSDFGGFEAPVEYSTQRFQRLSVEFYVDALRDSSNNVIESPGATAGRCNNIFSVVHGYLQRRDPETIVWGDLVTLGCALRAEGRTQPSPDGDWMQYKQVFYEVRLGGFTDIAL